MSLLFACNMAMEAQNSIEGCNFEATIPSQKNNKLYFAQYYKGATYALDSVILSEQGKATFSFKEKLPAGQYFLYIKPDFQLDLLIDDEQSNIKAFIDENDFPKSTISGSKDTKLLWNYLMIMQEQDRLKAKQENPDISEKERALLEKQSKALEERIQRYTKIAIEENKDRWFGKFLKGTFPIELPYPQPQTQEEANNNIIYGRQHFFDNIDLTDPRFWRTNYLLSNIDTYMTQWVEQSPDSLATAASKIVAKTQGNNFCFKEMLSKFVNQSMKSLVMGDENIWAKLAEDYIFDKDIPWIDSAQVLQIRRMYEPIKNNRIGMTAKNLRLETLNGDTINTDEIESEFLLLYIYDPGCGHCEKELPEIYNKIYSKYKDKGLKVVALNIASDKQAWKEFVAKHQLTDWINCADFGYKSEYWMYYDTSATPSTYILNKNKTIIAKKINLENIEKLFNYYIKE